MHIRTAIRVGLLTLVALLVPSQSMADGLRPVSNKAWNTAAVRKVLHTFAYGGFADEEQILAWSKMAPRDAINEILTFEDVNPSLSPPQEDNTADFGPSLSGLQQFWASENPSNPTCPSQVSSFSPTLTRDDGTTVLYNAGLQNTWIAAVNKRGLNPFSNKVGFWLVNYHMAVNLRDTDPPLIQDLYDTALEQLQAGEPFHRVLAMGASSAAVAREYGHRTNRYDNSKGTFKGNDDFAREFHQLFFRINGDVEDPDYHENVTIEHTAWILTGMELDKITNAYGTTESYEWWVAPIDFTDHPDDTGRNIRNRTWHYGGNLEVLNQTISGLTAEEKLYDLAEIAIDHPESLDNLPVSFIEFFADDNLAIAEKRDIRETWYALAGTQDDFLNLLRAYAISKAFHNKNTFKFRTAFDRNLTIFNQNTVDNEESYANSYTPRAVMLQQGAETFVPAHDVFGGQTSLNAANNPNLFKDAFNSNVDKSWRIAKTTENCLDTSGNLVSWEKDWSRIFPRDDNGAFKVKDVGEWLWSRFTGDNGKNYTRLERAHVAAFLAAGKDFGYLADPAAPDILYTKKQLKSKAMKELLSSLENDTLALDSDDVNARLTANYRVGLAVNFITMTPFMFATGGY